MTPTEADDLTARVLTVIHERLDGLHPALQGHAVTLQADRRRLVSDLAGVRDHDGLRCQAECADPCPDAHRYAAGILLTASLYGVTP